MDEHGAARRLLVAPTTLQALEVSVQLAEADTPLGLEMDESYTLTIQAPRATLTAPSVWGALRGLETFSQLVESAATGGGLTVSPTVITDSPRCAAPARQDPPFSTRSRLIASCGAHRSQVSASGDAATPSLSRTSEVSYFGICCSWNTLITLRAIAQPPTHPAMQVPVPRCVG
jgi:hypothetical protein